MNVLIRTAGGAAKKRELGLGHIYRTANLAQEFKGHNIYFLIEDYGGAKNILNFFKFNKIFKIPTESDISRDVKLTLSIVKTKKIDVVIIDKFKVNKKYVSNIKKYVKTVVISDLENIEYNADLLICGFIGYKNKITKNKFKTKCLLGPRYQILNKNFKKKNSTKKKKFELLATFGGFDEQNISSQLISSIMNNTLEIKTKIILGPSTKNNLKIDTKKNKKILQIKKQTKNMYEEMQEVRFGLCSGGLTTYEFASLGIPFGIICQNFHQLKTAREWEKRGIGFNLGLISKRTPIKIKSFIESISKNKMRKIKSGYVDGLGTKRIVKEILKLNNSSSLQKYSYTNSRSQDNEY